MLFSLNLLKYFQSRPFFDGPAFSFLELNQVQIVNAYLEEQVAGRTRVFVGEINVEVWSHVHRALRWVLEEAFNHPKLQSLNLSPNTVTIERFDPDTGLVEIRIED